MIKTNPNKKLISLKRQPLVLLIFSSISFLLILVRLIFLQLFSYESFKKMSDENRISKKEIEEKISKTKGCLFNEISFLLGIVSIKNIKFI